MSKTSLTRVVQRPLQQLPGLSRALLRRGACTAGGSSCYSSEYEYSRCRQQNKSVHAPPLSAGMRGPLPAHSTGTPIAHPNGKAEVNV